MSPSPRFLACLAASARCRRRPGAGCWRPSRPTATGRATSAEPSPNGVTAPRPGVPGVVGAYYAELIQGFESEAVQARASVHIVCTQPRRDSDEQVLEMAHRVGGVAVPGGTVSDRTLTKLAESLPVVLLGGVAPPGIVWVTVDNKSATAALTRHLLEVHGLRELIFAGNPTGSPDVTAERWQGFREAHRQLGIRAPRRPVRVGMQQHDGVIAIERLAQSGDPRCPTASCAPTTRLLSACSWARWPAARSARRQRHH